MSNDNPCRYCTKDTGRTSDCHSYCKKYKTWKAIHDKQVAEERQKRQAGWTPRTGNWYQTPAGHWRNKKSTRGRN